jgi:hypothetical protein
MLLNPEAGGRTGLFFGRGMVTDVAEITPRMRHIRLRVPAGLDWIPGQQIRVRLGRGEETASVAFGAMLGAVRSLDLPDSRGWRTWPTKRGPARRYGFT